MFLHVKELQYQAKPEKPDPVFARRMQEILGGTFGEMTVMMSYLFQGWNCRGPQKYRDMLLSTGTEEIGHVEMFSVMIARLLEGAPVHEVEDAARKNPAVGAAMGGMDMRDVMAGMTPQHPIVSGGGAVPKDSEGVPWNGAFVASSGNLMADFRFNFMAESQGNLQVARLYNMTDDPGIRDMFSFALARDIMHQNQWFAAMEELKADGFEDFYVPSTMPADRIRMDQAHVFWNNSAGQEAGQGRWAQGPAPDGLGEFQFLAEPTPLSNDRGELGMNDPRLHGTAKQPTPPVATGPNPVTGQNGSGDGLVSKIVEKVTS